jgi:hypothetical protein
MQKFNTLLESVFQKYQRGNFHAGDLVKFKESIDGHDWYKGLAVNKLEMVRAMMEGDLNLRVCAVKSQYPVMGHAHGDPSMEVGPWHVDIVQEVGPGGSWINFLTVPEDILEGIDTGINRQPVPDSHRKEDPSHIKPAKLGEDADELRHNQTMNSDGGTEEDRKLHDQNVKLDGATAASSYTGRYLDQRGLQPGN